MNTIKMQIIRHCSAILSLLILSCFATQIHGSKQSQALSQLHRSKLKNVARIDKSPFVAILHANATKTHPQEGLKVKDRIVKLPGQPNVKFSQYGGYVTVDKKAGRAMFYYLVEAEQAKDSSPLLLWLNGGPGCSSLAYGAMLELGPFRIHSDGKTLYRNRFSWNHAANVLFLESPAGVGFSYSNRTSDYDASGDRNTAADNYVFLVNWLERFPEYKGREFYISGESYAGHYVPQLAHTILYHNKRANKTIINLKGIIIGNAVINDETDTKGMYDYLASHAIISDKTANVINNYCNFAPNVKTDQRKECNDATDDAAKDTYYVDIYNIYAPSCLSTNLTAKPKRTSIFKFDPCSEDYVYAYLNRPDVQQALHANVTKLSHDWEPCSDVITWGDSASTVLPLLHEFLENGLRVWIFSGDIDGRVPVTSTKYSLDKMNLPVKTEWHAWFLSGEVAGYTQEFEGGLTFATVRQAGHQVPSYQPARGLSLIKHFLDGTPLPDTKRYN
ncbi:serine carboxypeptidase-like 40 [Pyrus ussuriensis x Pyrus communis]|uniref:Carboxypeptidase n=1 Tax=Pyrus ussuriensis x Pyrus communis TaxID=2448454 RepID=A0A5N5H6Y3_9ROSA|nr:serine carboxypeptidase-like 40 [Pyrus ussuriensis x Pyrus communis]